MPQSPEQSDSKPVKAKTIFSWLFDIAFLGGLIFFFAQPGKTESFWSAVSFSVHWLVTAPFGGDRSQMQKPIETASPVGPATASRFPAPPVFIPPPAPTAKQLATEVPGDCFPPEARKAQEDAAVAKLFYQPPAIEKKKQARKTHSKPIEFAKKKTNGVPYYQVTVDLSDPQSYLVIRLPHDANQANSTCFTAGHESFESFVKRCHAAAVVNGTFFSKDDQERVMGNMVSDGKMLKYSQWENYGTTLGLREGNVPEMVTARAEGVPDWGAHWFSLTCGPRLVKEGEIWLNPELEGFADPHVLGVGPRCAIGFPQSRDRLYLITFLRGLSLKEEAKLMQAIGCYEAMNLDGGASKALAHENSILVKPGRGLTNVLVVYDIRHKAPDDVIASWQDFQKSDSGDARK